MATTSLPVAATELIELTGRMTTHGGRSAPAPHKALLVLWSIWRQALDTYASRLIPYEEVHTPMIELLTAAGRGHKPRPWYPFVRLAHEPFWEVDGLFTVNEAGDVSSAASLSGVTGGFLPAYAHCLRDRSIASEVASVVATTWLPDESALRLNDLARDLAAPA